MKLKKQLSLFLVPILTFSLIFNFPAFYFVTETYADSIVNNPDGSQTIIYDEELPGTRNQPGIGRDAPRTGDAPVATGQAPRVPQLGDPRVNRPQGTPAADINEIFQGFPRSDTPPFSPDSVEKINSRPPAPPGVEVQSSTNTTRPRANPMQPSAKDLDDMMIKLMNESNPLEKRRLTGILFYHQSTYRNAVMQGQFGLKANSPQVQAFLEQKKLLQADVISRMGVNYKNQYGVALKQTILPFDYNSILSDDDIITGTGQTGRSLEKVYVESLNEVMRETVGRPMSAADRARVDVNGLAWNMTQDAAHLDFDHREKYINPQSGYANQRKLMEGAQQGKVTAYTFDEQGRMVKLSPAETVKEIQRLAVDKALDIPGIDKTRGSGAMSDFLRMGNIHSIKPVGKVTVEEVATFIRNQKYSERVIGDYDAIFQGDAKLSKEYQEFIELSAKLRQCTTVREVAELLEKSTGQKIIFSDGIIHYERLTAAMLKHQEKQLAVVLPKMIGAVTQTEAYKIVEYLKTAGKNSRLELRKRMALTYAPMDDKTVKGIASQIDRMSVDPADKVFLKSVIDGDSRQIRRYAELIKIPPEDLARRLKIDGDNIAVAKFISQTAEVRPIMAAVSKYHGGPRLAAFLETRTARALNLDVMLSKEAKGAKFMLFSMMTLAATRAYSASKDSKEGVVAIAKIMFEMIPVVAGALRFSEGEYRLAAKEWVMDVCPPIALANLAVMFMDYAIQSGISGWKESIKDEKAQQVLDMLTDEDFVESDIKCYYILKNRAGMLEFLDEVAPGLGNIKKLSSIIEPEIEAQMSRHPQVEINNQALHAVNWFEAIDKDSIEKEYKGQFTLTQLKAKVFMSGVPSIEQASPTVRVAAKLILDNLRIRKELYDAVLREFMDRIERLYNEEKEECEDDEWVQVVASVQAVIKATYEAVPDKIKEHAFGGPKLDAEYRTILEYLKNYDGSEKEIHDVKREMQEIIDQFRQFIKDLIFAVGLAIESEVMQLTTYIYGGDRSFEETDMVILGDRLRAGISARVDPSRKGQNWTVYYYAYNFETGQMEMVGSVGLSPGKFNTGGEGSLMVIQDPEKSTFFEFDNFNSKKYFPQERGYRVQTVLAFGGWSDPLAQVGPGPLSYPADYPDVFSEDSAAFLGSPVELLMIKPIIYASAPAYIYKNDGPQLKIALRVPLYARDEAYKDRFKVEIESFSYVATQDGPDINPDKHQPVSTDNFDPPDNPSISEIDFDQDAKEGTYLIEVKAEVRGVDEELQPLSRTVSVQYIDKEKEEDEDDQGDDTVPEVLAPLVVTINGLKASAEGLIGQANGIEASVKAAVESIMQKLGTYENGLNALETQLNSFEATMGGVPGRIGAAKAAAAEGLADAKAAAGLKNPIENETLGVCEKAQTMKNSDDPEKIRSLMGAVEVGYGSVKSKVADFLTKLQNAQGKTEQITGFISEIEFYRSERDRITGEAQSKADAPNDFETELTQANELINGFADLQTQLDQIKSDSSGVVTEAEGLTAEKIHPNDIPRLAEIKRIDGEVQGVGGIIEAEERVNAHISAPGAKATELNAKKDALKLRAADIRASFLPDDVFSELKSAQLDASSSYEAATLFQDAVESASGNALICYNVAKEQLSRAKTPQEQEAELDCSGKKGSLPSYNRTLKKAVCKCPPKTTDEGDQCKAIEEGGDDDGSDGGGQGGEPEGGGNVDEIVSIFTSREGTSQPGTTDSGATPGTGTGDDDPIGGGGFIDYAGEAGIKDRPKPPPKPPTIPRPPAPTTTTTASTPTPATTTTATVPKDPGLTNVTVSISTPVISMWDYGTEDFDTVSISVNGAMQVPGLRLTKAKQTLTLNLKEGVNVLKITAVNIGDPEINKRLNLPPYNAAAITFTHVIQGRSYQQWELSVGQSGIVEVEYRKQ